MKQLWSRFKPYLRIVVLVATLIFLGVALQNHWQEVTAIRIEPAGVACLAIALGVTLLSHLGAGWAWGAILAVLDQSVSRVWAIQVYLQTNLVKYLPSNVLHFYARTLAAKNSGIPLGTATLSVILEPLLMVAAALLVALVSFRPDGIQILGLIAVLTAVHPRVLNPLIHRLVRWRASKENNPAIATLGLKHYPLVPLLAEVGFLSLRGVGFILTILALGSVDPTGVPTLLGVYSMGWLLGFITPGAPGGLGVLEATVVALMNTTEAIQSLSPGVLLSALALYRLISTLSEVMGAGLVWLDAKFLISKVGRGRSQSQGDQTNKP